MAKHVIKAQLTKDRDLSQEEAAAHFGVNVRTINNWLKQGTLTGYRLGPRLIRIDRASIDGLRQPL